MRDLMGPVYGCLESLKAYLTQADMSKVARGFLIESIGVYELAVEEMLSRVNFVPELDRASLPRFVANGVLSMIQLVTSGYDDAVKRPIVSQSRIVLDAWSGRLTR
ncbi:MAG: hypothetical protein WBP12_05585 [Candidatus Saccharimonas sp.]